MKNSSQIILSLLTSCGFFGCIFFMLMWGFPAENKDQLNTLLGVLGTIWTLQMNYFYGSSSASRSKDETISDIAKMPPVATAMPLVIKNAESVKNETKEGDINVTAENPPLKP